MGWFMAVVAGMTAFYMFRLYYGIFWGTPSENSSKHLHEMPVMTIPLMILAAVTCVAGFIPFGHFVSSDGTAYNIHLEAQTVVTSIVIGLIAIALASFLYAREKQPVANVLQRRFKALWTAAYHRFYIDEIYQFITHKIIFGCISRPIAWLDRHVVDGFFNLLAWSANTGGEEIRGLQSGQVQQYAFVFLLGTLAIILFLLL
jgi:NADH-quinone oxidoreductase subunit L